LGDKFTNAVTSLYGAGATFEQHLVPMWKIPFQKATTKAKIAGLDSRFAQEAGGAPTASNVTLGGGKRRQRTSHWGKKTPATHVTLKKKIV
jgi:hypothetical protein